MLTLVTPLHSEPAASAAATHQSHLLALGAIVEAAGFTVADSDFLAQALIYLKIMRDERVGHA